MEPVQIIFYLLAGLTISSALVAVIGKRILRATVFLLFSLTSIAGLYFLMEFFFLAAVQIVVYIGGIVVLIIFAILLTHHIDHELEAPPFRKWILSAGSTLIGAALVLVSIWKFNFPVPSGLEPQASIETIGTSMLNYSDNGYVLPFEVISVLLLAAMIAVIVIAKRNQPTENE